MLLLDKHSYLTDLIFYIAQDVLELMNLLASSPYLCILKVLFRGELT